MGGGRGKRTIAAGALAVLVGFALGRTGGIPLARACSCKTDVTWALTLEDVTTADGGEAEVQRTLWSECAHLSASGFLFAGDIQLELEWESWTPER